ncbi:unnamed protein product [Hapterophycus canaliculatus]
MDSDDDDCPPGLVPVQDLGPLTEANSTSSPQDPKLSLDVDADANAEAPGAGAVPVTIVTGFLGAGKTTLLNYILTQDHGRRIAVIENEVGDSMDIESLIARDGADGSVLADNLFELKNGCICCTVKDDLVSTLETLLERRNKFDYVIIETTGLANPGPVASVFWLDDALESALRLDSIVTLIDAKNFTRQLQRVPGEEGGFGLAEERQFQPAERPQNEAAMQVAYADRVLVNKGDLVSSDTLHGVVAQVRAINAVAEIRCTERSTVDLAWILDTKCFSPELALAVDPTLASARTLSSTPDRDQGRDSKRDKRDAGTASGEVDPGDKAETRDKDSPPVLADLEGRQGARREGTHHHHHDGDGEACVACGDAAADREGPGGVSCSVHDPCVTTCAVDLTGSLDLSRLERWLGSLLWDPAPGGTEIYRVKGVVSVDARDERFVVQGVADLFEVAPAGVLGSAWKEGELRRCKIVFIGRLLVKETLERGVRSCMI